MRLRKEKHQFCTAWSCFAVQRASRIRGAHYQLASRRGGGSKARWQFAASGLFYVSSRKSVGCRLQTQPRLHIFQRRHLKSILL